MDIHQNNVFDTSLNDQNDDIVDNSGELQITKIQNYIKLST